MTEKSIFSRERKRGLGAVLVSAMLVACSSGPVRQEPVIERQAPPAVKAVPPKPAVRSESAPITEAAANLIDEARRDYQRGQTRAAQVKAERAQRLSPKSPLVYQILGEVQQSNKHYAPAEQFYRKAISLAGRDQRLLSSLWRQVALVRALQGDEPGAKVAREKAATYR